MHMDFVVIKYSVSLGTILAVQAGSKNVLVSQLEGKHKLCSNLKKYFSTFLSA
jgi:hypothetical protein